MWEKNHVTGVVILEMVPDSQHKLCMLSNTPCSRCCCCSFGSLFFLFPPTTVLIPHTSFLQSFLFYIFLLFSVNPSTSLLVILSNHLSPTPSSLHFGFIFSPSSPFILIQYLSLFSHPLSPSSLHFYPLVHLFLTLSVSSSSQL